MSVHTVLLTPHGLGCVQVLPGTGVSPGDHVAVTAQSLFLWTVNPLRVVYSKESTQGAPRWNALGQSVIQSVGQQPYS
jgi:hypothetical protein